MIRIIKITMLLCREVDWFKNGRCSTAENLVIFIWNQIHPLIPHPALLDQVLSSLIQQFQTRFSHPSSSSSRPGTLINHPVVLDQVLSSLIQWFQTWYSHPSFSSSRPGTLIQQFQTRYYYLVVLDQVLSSSSSRPGTLIQQFQTRYSHTSSSSSRSRTLILHPVVLNQVLSSLIQQFQTTGTLIPHPVVLDQELSFFIQKFQTRYSHPSSSSSRPGTLLHHPVVLDDRYSHPSSSSSRSRTLILHPEVLDQVLSSIIQ